jgi:hypothetical protein
MYTKRSPLTFAQYAEQMTYDPQSGVFTWKQARSRRYKAGMEIGNIKSRIDKYGHEQSYRYIGLFGQQVPAQRVAWLMQTGEWPKGNILFKDEDSTNLKFDNLKEADFPVIKIQTIEGKTKYKMPRNQARRFGLKRYYGLTLETYNVMLAAQGGVCAICKGAETYQPKTYDGPKALSVDHNHATGAIRGLLCSRCNYMIGHSMENPDVLIEGAAYLRKHNGEVRTAPTLTLVPTEGKTS